MQLAPIILFTYNRPWHTQNVLDNLALNEEAKDSVLYIYCDGTKENAEQLTLDKVSEVRLLAKNENRFKEVIVKEQVKNKGLANSIIDGVTEVINKHGNIIVLEDDLVPSIGFLKYMNTALQVYEHESKVSAIHAWGKRLDKSITKEQTFFLKGADCWGWATWQRNWVLFNYDAKDLYKQITEKGLEDYFNLYGAINYTGMLHNQIDGKIDSWAIRWQASMFLLNKLCLHPVDSLIKNIGTDGSGIHCGTEELKENIVEHIIVTKIEIEENIGYYFGIQPKSNNKVDKVSFKDVLRTAKRFLLGQ